MIVGGEGTAKFGGISREVIASNVESVYKCVNAKVYQLDVYLTKARGDS